jgi:hypothetical protein
MSKQDFIALADTIRENNNADEFTEYVVEVLADFCAAQNPNFKRDRWLGYIAGTNGSSGKVLKP